MTRTTYVNLLAWLQQAQTILADRLRLCQRGTYRTDCIKCAEFYIVEQAYEVRSVRAKLSAWFHGSRVGIEPWVSVDLHNAVSELDYRYGCVTKSCSERKRVKFAVQCEIDSQPKQSAQ